jgi:hypothetical protein
MIWVGRLRPASLTGGTPPGSTRPGVRLCKTEPNVGKRGYLGARSVGAGGARRVVQTNPISGGRPEPRRAKCAKQTQFRGRPGGGGQSTMQNKPNLPGGCHAKQSQSPAVAVCTNKPNWDRPIAPNKANCQRYRMGQTGGALVRLCKTNPICGVSGRRGRSIAPNKPNPRRWLVVQTNPIGTRRSRQTKPIAGGAAWGKPEGHWCDYAKQSQTWASRGIWGKARGGAYRAKRTQS